MIALHISSNKITGQILAIHLFSVIDIKTFSSIVLMLYLMRMILLRTNCKYDSEDDGDLSYLRLKATAVTSLGDIMAILTSG